MTTAARNETKAKRRSEVGTEGRLAELEREVERLKANQRLLEAQVKRLESMLLLVKR